MHAGAKHPLQTGKQYRIVVEILPEIGPGFLCVNQANLPALADQVSQYAQERPLADIKVFYIGGPHPEVFLHVGNAGNDLLEVGFVCNVLGHIAKLRTYENISE